MIKKAFFSILVGFLGILALLLSIPTILFSKGYLYIYTLLSRCWCTLKEHHDFPVEAVLFAGVTPENLKCSSCGASPSKTDVTFILDEIERTKIALQALMYSTTPTVEPEVTKAQSILPVLGQDKNLN